MERLTAPEPPAVAEQPLDIAWWDGDTFSRVHVVKTGGYGVRCGAPIPPDAAESLTTGDWLPGPRCAACAAG